MQRFISRRLIVTIITWALASLPALSAVPDTRNGNTALKGNDAWIRHVWEPKDGLPDGPVNRIIPAADGSMLAATAKGRVRFDGTRVHPLAPPDPESQMLDHIPRDPWLAAAAVDPTCTSQCRAADGSIFRAHSSGTVSQTRDGFGKRLAKDEGVMPATSAHVAADRDGRVWLAQNGQLAMFDDVTRTFTRIADLPSGRITIAPARAGGIWIKVNDKLFRYDDASGLVAQVGSAPHGFTLLYEDSSGRLWIGSDYFGLHVHTHGSFAPVPTRGDGVFSIAEDRDGGVWVGTSTAVNRITPGVVRGFVAERTSLQLPNSICQDGDGAIWIATESGNLGILPPDGLDPTIQPLTPANGWEGGIAHCVASAADGGVWVGTRTGGIWHSSDGRFVKVPSPPGTPDVVLPNEFRIYQLLETRCGDLWSVTRASVCRWRNDIWRAVEPDTSDLADLTDICCIAEDHAGGVWLATWSRCVYAVDAEAMTATRVDLGELADGTITSICPSDAGSVWIAVRDKGLCRLRDGEVRRLGVEQGLPSLGILAVVADQAGLLWCVCSQQVFVVSRAEIERVADGSLTHVHPWVLSGSDGVTAFDANDPPHCRAMLDRDGRVWITLRRGLAICDPVRLSRPARPPKIEVEGVRIGGSPLSVGGDALAHGIVMLPPDPRLVEIYYAARSFATPVNTRIQHRLEGFDADWVTANADLTARYARLPAGRYALRLRSSNDHNVWEEPQPAVTLDVQPLLWERPWFRFTALASAAGLAAAVAVGGATLRNRSRLARLEQQAALEEQRMRIARDMHDEAGTTATQLALLADLARSSADGPARAERLDGVSRIARQLVTSLDEMVWAVNPTNDTLAHLVSYLGQTASTTLGRFGVGCRVRAAEPLPACTATAEFRRGMLLIAKEAVSNVVEHAEATSVAIDIGFHNGRLTMSIEDDGRGIPDLPHGRSHGPGGNGLGNMQARAADLGGSCRIERSGSGGTRVLVDVPLASEART